MWQLAVFSIVIIFGMITEAQGDIPDAELAKQRAVMWRAMKDEELLKLLSDSGQMSLQVNRPAHMEEFIKIVVSRPFYEKDRASVSKKLWQHVLNMRDSLTRIMSKAHPSNLATSLRAYACADYGPILLDLVEKKKSDGRILAVCACKHVILASAAGTLTVHNAFDPLTIIHYQVLNKAAGNTGANSFSLNGVVVHNLGSEDLVEYLSEAEKALKTRNKEPERFDDSKGRDAPLLTTAEFTDLVKRLRKRRDHLAGRAFPAANARYALNDLRAAYKRVKRDPSPLLEAIADRSLWTRQRGRVYDEALLLGALGAEDGAGPLVDFLCFDIGEDHPEGPNRSKPREHPIARSLVMLGAVSVDPVITAFLKGDIPLSYAAAIVGSLLPLNIAKEHLKALETEENRNLISELIERLEQASKDKKKAESIPKSL